MEQQTVQVAVVGASGYSGEELVRLLLRHPYVRLTRITSRQYAGKSLAEVFPRFARIPSAQGLRFTEPDVAALQAETDVIFLALPHGVAAEFAVPLIEAGKRVIDLSADFRLRDPERYRQFYKREHPAPTLLAKAVYGLPELYAEAIRSAQLVASPGCYPTGILLPLIPLLRERVIAPEGIIVNSLSGVSGAGRKAEIQYSFVECHESLRPYAVPVHRHLSEIEQELEQAADRPVRVRFTPHLVPVNRGILTTITCFPGPALDGLRTDPAAVEAYVTTVYRQAYAHAPFVHLLGNQALPDTKHVVGTNMIQIAWRWDPRTELLVIMSAEDNLVKGASGQAVQSFNLMCGFPEETGLL